MRAVLGLGLCLGLLAAAMPAANAGEVLYDWSLSLPIGDPHRHIVRAFAPPGATLYAQATCFEGAFVQIQVISTAVGGVGSVACSPESISEAFIPGGDPGNVFLVVTAEGTLLGEAAIAHAFVSAD